MTLTIMTLNAIEVSAQGFEPGETVTSRFRPELDSLGARTGSFMLYASLDFGFMHNSNIFADDRITVDDYIALIAPALSLTSDWKRHGLSVGADLVAARYFQFDNENYDDYRIWIDGSVDVGRDELSAQLLHADLHELRTSPNDERGIEPTRFTIDTASIGYIFRPAQFYLDVGVKYDLVEFSDTLTFTGPVNNDDRDRDVVEASLRFGYETSPDYALFVEPIVYSIDYFQELDRFGFNRSSDGYDVIFGSEMNFSGVTFGEVFIGYRRRNYEDPRFEMQDGPIFGGDVTWNVTGLTTINFLASQIIAPTTLAGSSGIETGRLSAEVDHELFRSLILNFNASIHKEDYLDIEREDDIYVWRFGGTYTMNRFLYLDFAYDYQQRDTHPSDSGGRQYKLRTFYVGLKGQL